MDTQPPRPPRPRMLGFLIAAVLGVCAAVIFNMVKDEDSEEPTVEADEVSQSSSNGSQSQPVDTIDLLSPSVDAEASDVSTRMRYVTINRGDHLSSIFARNDLSDRDLQQILNTGTQAAPLAKIYEGERLGFLTDPIGRLDMLEYQPRDRSVRYQFFRLGDAFQKREIHAEQSLKNQYKSVVIQKGEGPISAGERMGIKEATVLQITTILRWDIDFFHDIWPDDSFRVLYHQLYLDGEYTKDADIIALEFTNRDEVYQLFRHEVADEFKGYFRMDGTPSQKRFLRSPLEYRRISSEFQPQGRFHPVLKRWRPHNGIDYAAPTGTPVRATGRGIVTTAKYTDAQGNHVVIDHDGPYVTKYFHLSKFGRGVKSGATVQQGQVIGYVGSTGLATGPHLHYEFIENGRHVNPRTVSKFASIEPLDGAELASFQRQALLLEEEMANLHLLHEEQVAQIAKHDTRTLHIVEGG